MSARGVVLGVLLLSCPLTAQTLSDPVVVSQATWTGDPVLVENKTIWCVGDAPAIDLRFPDSPSAAWESCVIRNVMVLDGAMAGAPACQVGIRIVNGWNCRLENVTSWSAFARMGGIEFRGRTIDAHVTRFHGYGLGTHIALLEQGEGLTVDDSRLVGGVTGVLVSTDANRPGLWVTHSHINVQSRGIRVLNHPQNILVGNLIYRQGAGPFVGIDLGPGTGDSVVRDNIVHCGAATGNAVAIAGMPAEGNVQTACGGTVTTQTPLPTQGCTTAQPASNWRCVSGNWLPPGM
jgi:hypothetical protein